MSRPVPPEERARPQTFSASDEVWTRWKAAAARRGLSTSALIRQAVERELEAEEEGVSTAA